MNAMQTIQTMQKNDMNFGQSTTSSTCPPSCTSCLFQSLYDLKSEEQDILIAQGFDAVLKFLKACALQKKLVSVPVPLCLCGD